MLWDIFCGVSVIFVANVVIVILMNIIVEKVIVKMKMDLNDESIFFTILETSEKILFYMSLIFLCNVLINLCNVLISAQ